jgi:hypothetical protein
LLVIDIFFNDIGENNAADVGLLSQLVADCLHYLNEGLLIYPARGGVDGVSVDQYGVIPAL